LPKERAKGKFQVVVKTALLEEGTIFKAFILGVFKKFRRKEGKKGAI